MKYDLHTIFRVANIMARSMNRSQAFKAAWSMAKGQHVEKVSGVQFGNRQTALRHLTQYSEDVIRFHLVREQENRYDLNAVAVIAEVIGRGQYKAGYLIASTASIVAPIMDRGVILKAGLKSIVGGFGEGLSYGLRVKVAI
jgi:hypothetical protein